MDLQVGDVVGIPYRGVRHEGIVSVAGDENTAQIVHNSKRRARVVEESAAIFRSGRPLTVITRSPCPDASVAYARSFIASGRPWRYLDNCQTFTREVSGTSIPSREANGLAFALLATIVTVAALRAA